MISILQRLIAWAGKTCVLSCYQYLPNVFGLHDARGHVRFSGLSSNCRRLPRHHAPIRLIAWLRDNLSSRVTTPTTGSAAESIYGSMPLNKPGGGLQSLREFEKPAVVGAMVRLGNCFDLLDPVNVQSLKALHAAMMKQWHKTKAEIPQNGNQHKNLTCDFQ